MPKGIVTPGRNQSGGPLRDRIITENNPYLATYFVWQLDDAGGLVIQDQQPVLLPLLTNKIYQPFDIVENLDIKHILFNVDGVEFDMVMALEPTFQP